MFLLRSLRGLSLQIPTDWKRSRGADARGAARRRLTGGGTPALQEEASVGTEGCGENRPTLAVLQQGSFTSLVLSVEDQGPSVPRGKPLCDVRVVLLKGDGFQGRLGRKVD